MAYGYAERAERVETAEERGKKADRSGGYGYKGKSVYCVSWCVGDKRTGWG